MESIYSVLLGVFVVGSLILFLLGTKASVYCPSPILTDTGKQRQTIQANYNGVSLKGLTRDVVKEIMQSLGNDGQVRCRIVDAMSLQSMDERFYRTRPVDLHRHDAAKGRVAKYEKT